MCPGAADRKRKVDPEHKSLEKRRNLKGWKRFQAERAATGKKREAAAEPTFHNAVRRDQSLGSRNRERKEAEAARQRRRSERAQIEGRFEGPEGAQARLALPKLPNGTLSRFALMGSPEPGLHRSFALVEGSNRGP